MGHKTKLQRWSRQPEILMVSYQGTSMLDYTAHQGRSGPSGNTHLQAAGHCVAQNVLSSEVDYHQKYTSN